MHKTYKVAKRRDASLQCLIRDSQIPESQLISSNPSNILIILNAGSTGNMHSIDPIDLRNLFRSGVIQLIMPLSRPFSIIEFSNTQDALNAYQLLNQSHQLGRILQMAFLTTVPQLFLKETILSGPKEIQAHIPGLIYCPDFITSEEETSLLMDISQLEDAWIPLHQRRVQHFGYIYDYPSQRTIPSGIDFPEWMRVFLSKYHFTFPEHPLPNQCTINVYEEGGGIGPHMDTLQAFEDGPVVSLSLGSDVLMDFRRGSDAYQVNLCARSLLIMTGESRLQWEHGIRSRKTELLHGRPRIRKTRISLTFRRAQGACAK